MNHSEEGLPLTDVTLSANFHEWATRTDPFCMEQVATSTYTNFFIPKVVKRLLHRKGGRLQKAKRAPKKGEGSSILGEKII